MSSGAVSTSTGAMRVRLSAMEPSRPSGQGARRARVADREDLPQVTIVILLVEVAAAEACVDLHVVFATGVASIRVSARLYLSNDVTEDDIVDDLYEVV